MLLMSWMLRHVLDCLKGAHRVAGCAGHHPDRRWRCFVVLSLAVAMALALWTALVPGGAAPRTAARTALAGVAAAAPGGDARAEPADRLHGRDGVVAAR